MSEEKKINKYKRSKKDIQKYQHEYYKKTSIKVKCEYCNRMITMRNLKKHETSYFHIKNKNGIIIKRKTRCDKGIKLKDKNKPEFKPSNKLIFIV
jgi:hypothetical protein